MRYYSISQISRMGRKVDPIILEVLALSSAPDFLSPLQYHFKSGGKRMRAVLVVLSCAAAGGAPEGALRPAAVVEMIHNYSLVMDDLIDRGVIRRGKPTVRVALGNSVALLVAMFYREVLDDLIQECPAKARIRDTAVHAMKDIIDGERLDLLFEQAGREDPYLKSNRIQKPSFHLYLEMIGKKTAALFRAAAEIGAYSARAKPNIVNALGMFGWKSGLAFQVMDDVLDICGSKTGKQQAKDIIEHKLGNAATLMALEFLPAKKRAELLAILRLDKVSRQMASRAREMVAQTPAELACREIAKRYLEEAKQHLSVLEDSEYKQSLEELSERFVSRTF